MKKQEVIDNLKKLNKWRRYYGELEKSPKMPHPKEIGETIDEAIRILELK